MTRPLQTKRWATLKNVRLFTLLFLMLSLASAWHFSGLAVRTASAVPKTYTIGVVPQFEQRKLHAIWRPIIEDLEKRTGLTFDLKSTLTIAAFEKAIERGEFDFVYLNPYHIVQVHDRQGYIPLVADKERLYAASLWPAGTAR